MLIDIFTDHQSLAFIPNKPCFSTVEILWKDVILNPSLQEHPTRVNLSDKDPNDLISDLYTDLSFIEWCQLYGACAQHPHLFEHLHFGKLMAKQNIRFSPRTQQLFEKLGLMENTFTQWCCLRKISEQDLMPLNALESWQSFAPFSDFFENQKLTRSEGKEVIDLLVDLILMKTDSEKLIPDGKQTWLEQLQELRQPFTSHQDQKQMSDEAAAWPKYVQVQKWRQGDKILERMQITYQNKQDLFKKLQFLKDMESQ